MNTQYRCCDPEYFTYNGGTDDLAHGRTVTVYSKRAVKDSVSHPAADGHLGFGDSN